MATANATPSCPPLGAVVHLTETVHGSAYERRGTVVGLVVGLPGSRCSNEFLLDQDDGNCVFYSPGEVVITHIE